MTTVAWVKDRQSFVLSTAMETMGRRWPVAKKCVCVECGEGQPGAMLATGMT